MKKHAIFFIAFAVFVLMGATTSITWLNIRSTSRHGNGTKGQSSDGTGTSGHVAAFDSNGNITDGGAGGATGPTGPSGPSGPTGPTGSGGAITSGSIASLPACSTTAGLYLPTDTLYNFVWCDGASANHWFWHGQAVTPPSGTFAWTNQGSATVTKQTNGIWSFTFVGVNTNVMNFQMYDAATPTAPFALTYRLNVVSPQGLNNNTVGVHLRESGTGKIVSFGIQGGCGATSLSGSNVCTLVVESPSATASNGSQTIPSQTQLSLNNGWNGDFIIKVSVASGSTGNISFTVSYDGGLTFPVTAFSVAKNSYFTTAPDNIGVFANTTDLNGAVFPPTLQLISID